MFLFFAPGHHKVCNIPPNKVILVYDDVGVCLFAVAALVPNIPTLHHPARNTRMQPLFSYQLCRIVLLPGDSLAKFFSPDHANTQHSMRTSKKLCSAQGEPLVQLKHESHKCFFKFKDENRVADVVHKISNRIAYFKDQSLL